MDNLEVVFKADLSNIRRGLSELGEKLGQTERQSEKAAAAVRGPLSTAAGAATLGLRGLAAAAAAFGAASFATSATTYAAGLERLARNAGLSTDEFQRLQSAIGLAGIDIQAGDAFRAFAKNIDLARTGAGELTEVLKFLHPELLAQIKTSKGTADALNIYADAIARLSSAEDRAVLARKAFGDEGANLLPLLEKGRIGLAESTKEAEKFSTAISKDAVAAADAFGDEWTNLTRELQAQFVTASQGVLSAGAGMFKSLREGLAGLRNGTITLSDIFGGATEETRFEQRSLGIVNGLSEIASAASAASKALRAEQDAAQDAEIASGGRTKLGSRPDFRAADALAASRQGLASARGDQFAAIGLQTRQEVEQAKRLLGELAISSKDFEEIRSNAAAAGAARRRLIEEDQARAVKALQVQTLEAGVSSEATLAGEYVKRVEIARAQNELELANWQRLHEQRLITAEQFATARATLAEQEAIKVREASRQATAGIEAALSGAFDNLVTNSLTNASGAAKQFGLDLVNGLAKAISQALILKPLINSLFSGQSGSFGDVVGSALGLIGPGRAEGGAVMAGVPTLINERRGRRPEVFVPSTSGRMVPGERFNGGSASAAPANVYNIDARGSDAGVTARISQALQAVERQRANPVSAGAAYRRRFPLRAA